MRIFIKRYAAGTLSAASTAVLPTLTLTWRQRTRNRQKLFLDNGDYACVMLPRATVMNNGDVLEAWGGLRVKVCAANEHVLQVRAKAADDLMRVAYQLGKQQVPVQALPNMLQLACTPAVLDMLAGMPGVRAQSAYAPFSPEPELSCTHALGQTEHDHDADPHVAVQHNRSGADPANANEHGLSERVYFVAEQPSL